MYKKFFFILELLFYYLLFFSCKSTKLNNENFTSIPYIIEDNVVFDNLEDEEEPYKYIFIRLYNPIYSNPFYFANILKSGIALTEVYDLEVSHSSINFSLDDNFYGLTAATNPPMAIESCTDVADNSYMNQCNTVYSEQLTYALKVTEHEYNYIKDTVMFYYKYPKLTYAIAQNFRMAGYQIKRKFFKKKNKQFFGDVDYYPTDKKRKKKEMNNRYIADSFVCSSFISYVLINTVPRIHEWFKEHNINYRYVNVTDLTSIPGIKPLFYSTWDNYLVAANLFVEENPEFKEYLNN